jgi:glycosyltransferase involved in cell wall biosynthesis
MRINGLKFHVIRLQSNQGHGNARRIGLDKCSHELVALMDADDISVPDRFEKELKCFEENKELSVVGGLIEEFIGTIDNVVGIRYVPTEDKDIKTFIKKRCPFNQMSVMFKKSDVLSAGGYIDWYNNEDYYLWIRMYQKGMIFKNIAENLVFVRIGEEMYRRRGGWKYFQSEAKLQVYMLKHGIIGLGRFIYNVGIRFAVQVMMPNKLRGYVFKFTRKKVQNLSTWVGVKEVPFNTAGNKLTNQPKSSTSDIPFSVSMCVYKNDNPEHFDQALSSIIHQTIRPSEIVLVVDGPIPDSIESVIGKYQKMLGVHLLKYI